MRTATISTSRNALICMASAIIENIGRRETERLDAATRYGPTSSPVRALETYIDVQIGALRDLHRALVDASVDLLEDDVDEVWKTHLANRAAAPWNTSTAVIDYHAGEMGLDVPVQAQAA